MRDALLPILFLYLVIRIPAWRIVTKAGYHGAWTLLLLVPVFQFASIWMFAFSKWPIERK